VANTFTREDSRTCFRCDQDPPSFRLILLERFPNESRELEPDCMTGLFCAKCLRLEIDEHFDAISQNKEPLGKDESTDSCLCRQIGFTVVPLTLSEDESKLLVGEIEADWLEAMVN